MIVKLDGKSVTEDKPDGFIIRRAPGNCHYDFVQEINFAKSQSCFLDSEERKADRSKLDFTSISKGK